MCTVLRGSKIADPNEFSLKTLHPEPNIAELVLKLRTKSIV